MTRTRDHRRELALSMLRLVHEHVTPHGSALHTAVAAVIRDAGGNERTPPSTPIDVLLRPPPETPIAIASSIVVAMRCLLRGVPDSAEWRLAIAYLRLARLTDREPDLVPAPHRQDLARDFGRGGAP